MSHDHGPMDFPPDSLEFSDVNNVMMLFRSDDYLIQN